MKFGANYKNGDNKVEIKIKIDGVDRKEKVNLLKKTITLLHRLEVIVQKEIDKGAIL